MLSLAEWSHGIDIDYRKRIVFSPTDIALFSLSILWSLYHRLFFRPTPQRILYLWSDDTLSWDTVIIPQSSWVKPILGKTILYDDTLLNWLHDIDMVKDDNYFSKSEFRYTHTHYLSFLRKVKVFPIVFSDSSSLIRYKSSLESLTQQSNDTLIIMADAMQFSLEETKDGPQIVAHKSNQYTWFDMFCVYCDHYAITPTIMKIEIAKQEKDTILYQWVLVA